MNKKKNIMIGALAVIIIGGLIMALDNPTTESISWDNTKSINISNVLVEAPREFTTCSISPDNGDGWDNCTAYFTVYNGLANYRANRQNYLSRWAKENEIRNMELSYTKEVTKGMIEIIDVVNETYNETRYEGIANFSNFQTTIPDLNKGETLGVKMKFQKQRWKANSFNISAKFGAMEVILDPDVSACGTLSSAGTYTLINNITTTGTCITIGAHNVKLEGAGYTISYANSAAGYGILDTSGYDNLSVNNVFIKQNVSVTGSSNHAIGATGMITSNITNNNILVTDPSAKSINLITNSNNNKILNNTITTLGSSGMGTYIESSSSNTISNNTITTSDSNGYGVYLSSSSNSNIISNNTINTSNSYTYGITIQSSSNSNNITNNTITTSGTYGYGVYLISSSSNTLLNNNILTKNTNAYGIYIYTSTLNSIIGGSIIAQKSYDYYFDLDSATNTNNFTSTNFTAKRWIYFQDSSTWFNYQNDSTQNIRLKNNLSALGSLNRTLLSWSQTNMTWTDKPSGTLTANYTLTGLLANTDYNFTNVTTSQTVTTNSNGDFSVNIVLATGVTATLSAISLGGDSTAPTYSLNSTNSTVAGSSIKHSLYWQDETALSGYIFSFNNGTGTFVNNSWVAMSGTGNWSNVTKSVNSTVGTTIQWKVYANDTSNNWNTSLTYSYVTTSASSCTCPASGTNWAIALSDYCVISTTCDIGTGNITFTGTGNVTLNASITAKGIGALGGTNKGYLGSNARVRVG